MEGIVRVKVWRGLVLGEFRFWEVVRLGRVKVKVGGGRVRFGKVRCS